MSGPLLWVTAEPPDFTVGGGAVRQAQMLRALRAAFDPLELLVVGRVEDASVRELFDSIDALEVAARRSTGSSAARRRARDLRRVAARLPAEVADRASERAVLRAALSARAGTTRYSVVHVEHLGLAGVAPPQLRGCRSLDVQNIPSRMAAQSRAAAPGRRQRWLIGREVAAAERYQRGAVAACDVVSVVSASDGADLGLGPERPSAGSAPTLIVVPNGVDPDKFGAAAGARRDEPMVVFTGTLDYLPNVDGILWFAREVWPRVTDRLPAARLSIVGRRPVEELRALADAGAPAHISLHADVASVVPHLAGARVAVVPIRVGSGSRVKALEAMAAGCPVAATTVGLEGLDVTAGVHALVGDSPAQLAAAVLRLLEDGAAAARVGAAGRDLVTAHYTWDAIGSRYAEELAEVASRSSPA